ncbi:unnamed protein product, partial [Ectocarpus fasciculatus]
VRSIRRSRAHLPGQSLEERKEAALRSPPHSHPENTAAEVFSHARLANDSRGQHALPPSTHTDDGVGGTGLLRGGEDVGHFLYRSSLHVAAGQVKRSCGDRGHVRQARGAQFLQIIFHRLRVDRRFCCNGSELPNDVSVDGVQGLPDRLVLGSSVNPLGGFGKSAVLRVGRVFCVKIFNVTQQIL